MYRSLLCPPAPAGTACAAGPAGHRQCCHPSPGLPQPLLCWEGLDPWAAPDPAGTGMCRGGEQGLGWTNIDIPGMCHWEWGEASSTAVSKATGARECWNWDGAFKNEGRIYCCAWPRPLINNLSENLGGIRIENLVRSREFPLGTQMWRKDFSSCFSICTVKFLGSLSPSEIQFLPRISSS